MHLTLVRHATLVVRAAGLRLLENFTRLCARVEVPSVS